MFAYPYLEDEGEQVPQMVMSRFQKRMVKEMKRNGKVLKNTKNLINWKKTWKLVVPQQKQRRRSSRSRRKNDLLMMAKSYQRQVVKLMTLIKKVA